MHKCLFFPSENYILGGTGGTSGQKRSDDGSLSGAVCCKTTLTSLAFPFLAKMFLGLTGVHKWCVICQVHLLHSLGVLLCLYFTIFFFFWDKVKTLSSKCALCTMF